MKIRNGFVSNSSSSSFVINLAYLSAIQAYQIEDHIEESKRIQPEIYASHEDKWIIEVSLNEIKGATIMDNFDMASFLEKIYINPNVIKWGN